MLKGKNALITGTNRGIGKSLVEVFAKNGANVWACVRKIDENFLNHCKKISELYEVEIKPVAFEMTDDEQMKLAVKNIKNEKISVDILVNNAGIVPENRLFNMASSLEMYRIVANEYPQCRFADEALFQSAFMVYRRKDALSRQEAIGNLKKLINKHGKSPYLEISKDILKKLEEKS